MKYIASSKKILAMLLMLVLTVGCVGEVSYAAEPSKEQQVLSETVSAGDIVDVDISANLLQKGGFLKNTSAGEDGYYEEELDRYLAVDGKASTAKSVLKTAFDSFAVGCDLTRFQLTAEGLNALIAEILNTEPRYFYVNGFYRYTYDNNTGYIIRIYDIGYDYSKSQASAMLAAYDAAVEQALSGASMDWSDMEKALYINDYLARNCEYDTTYSKYTAYDALVNQTAVCQGYTMACVELANQLGLACEIVSSSSMNHAWNMIRVNGKYYNLDITWNDPVNDYLGRVNHFYLMKSTDYFQSEEIGHYAEDDWVVTGGLTDTDASDTSYDNYFWNPSDTGFDYIDGYWYGFDGLETITKYSCDGTNFYEEQDLVTVDNTWYITGTNESYRIKFPGFGAYEGILYISVPNAILSYSLSTGELTTEYLQTEADEAEGSIYGLYISSKGDLYFQVGRSYNEPGEVYKVVYPSKEYTITYKLNGGKNHSSNPGSYTDDGETITLKSPTRKGYTFKGWYKDGAYKNKITKIARGTTGDLTLYAKWAVNKYTIKFAGNGATSGEMTSLKDRKYGTSYKLTANAFKRKGYSFAGWNTKADGSGKSYKNGDSVKNLTSANGETVTLYAKWTPNKYTIKFEKNGATSGKMSAMKNRKYGTKYTLSKNTFKRKGYTFTGWNTKKNGKGKNYKNKGSVKNLVSKNGNSITLYAQWKKDTYKITYKLNKGTNNKSNPKKYSVTSKTITLKKPTRKGYTFKGWYSDSKFKKKVTKITKGSTGDITLYAKWKKK